MRNTNRNPFLSCIRKFSGFIFILLLCVTLCSSLTEPVQVEAATNPVFITSCRLNGTKKIRITATVSNMRRIGGSRCYLFALTPGSSRISSSARPIASARKSNKMTFSCPSTLNNTSLLYHGFAIASRNSRGKYTQISTKRYISNPGALARYRYRFPKAVSKKGLQINADMLEDAEELNVHNSDIAWNLAYHPYSSPLTEPRFWANTNGQIRNSLSSPVINMGNIQILTRYIRQKYGSRTRIILSEQGYTSIQNGKNVEKLQAAAIAYSYLISESDNMIDSLIIHRQVDHTAEISQGLNLGLWTTSASSSSPENARSKKLSWNIYKYMDTSLSNFATSSLVSSIGGARSWRQLIPSYSNRLYNKVSCTIGRLTPVSGYKKTGSVSKSWTAYGASRSFNKKGDNFTIYRDTSRNQNISWGYTQSFKKNLNVSSSPRFCTTLRVTGATKTSVQIKIRFFCGKQYFECARNIPTRRTVHLSTTLANWKYCKNITKIQILAQPVSGASWKSGARFELTAPVLCR